MNTVYIIAPDLTLRASLEANGFLEAIHRALQDFISVPILRTLSQLLMTVPDAGDAVVFFNREDAEYLEGLTQFLQKAGRAGAVILPIAISIAARRPPAVVGDRQSFDLTEQLRQRALTSSHAPTVANVFARQVLSILKPTLITEPMHLFLSHPRLDGEDVTLHSNAGKCALGSRYCTQFPEFAELFVLKSRKAMHAKRIVSSLYLYPGQTLAGTSSGFYVQQSGISVQ